MRDKNLLRLGTLALAIALTVAYFIISGCATPGFGRTYKNDIEGHGNVVVVVPSIQGTTNTSDVENKPDITPKLSLGLDKLFGVVSVDKYAKSPKFQFVVSPPTTGSIISPAPAIPTDRQQLLDAKLKAIYEMLKTIMSKVGRLTGSTSIKINTLIPADKELAK